MIDKSLLEQVIEKELEGNDCFLVELQVRPGNEISVSIDSDGPVDIAECEKLTRAIESAFNRDEEDYELEVGSAGITSPFKVKRQYDKYIGREVEVLPKDGKKITGVLIKADDASFTVRRSEKVKHPGMKRPVIEEIEQTFPYEEVKYTKYLLKF